MALIPYPDMADASDEMRRYLERFTGDHGRTSLLRRMLAWSVPASEAMDQLYHPVFTSGNLDRRLKELLFVAASEQRKCLYCMGGHSRFLVNEYGYTRDEVEAMRQGEMIDGMDDREHALVQIVRRAATDDEQIDSHDIDSLKSVGWDDGSIVEAIAVVAHAYFTNTFAQAMHLEEDIQAEGLDGYF